MLRPLKRQARRFVDRLVSQPLERQSDDLERRIGWRLDALGHPAPDPILLDFNELLHELRTIELRRLPVDGGVLLSAGCAGAWYFDWLAECAGPFERHLGVELYAPEPDGLAPNVTWIAESAGAMPSVPDGSVDVVFSGQNIEHLWIDGMADFLLEARRVLRPGGVLVVDSPNRLVTERLGWVQPEHTIELSPAEATELFELAGFASRSVRGLWSCRDQRSGEMLDLLPRPNSPREVLERAVGRRPVDDDFVWWIEAEPGPGDVDAGRLRCRVEELFAAHWPTRVMRGATHGEAGVVTRTQGFPIFAGDHRVSSAEPELTVRLIGADGTLLAEGAGAVEGRRDTTAFGVVAELVETGGVARTRAQPPAVAVELRPAV